MRNCPSALAGAVTDVRDTSDGVEVTITAEDRATIKRIIKLADVHARIGLPTDVALEHTGLHGGPGDIGHCPIIHVGTDVQATRLPNGARLHVRALSQGTLKALQAETRDRAGNLPRWVAKE